MARSNLNISSFLSEAFLSAQQPSDESRCIKVLIEGESLTLASVINRQRDVGSDFDELALPALNQHEASILLFSLADGHKDNQKWLLVSYIPDGCKVRDKMLYSSSREDLKRALGLSFFTAEYSANSLDEVRWDLVKAYLSNDRCNEIFLSEAERIVQDEKVLSHAESVFAKSSAMGELPFTISAELSLKFQNLRSSTEYNLIEMNIIEEEVRYVSDRLTDGPNICEYIHADEPRFLALSLIHPITESSMTYLIFSCPEKAPIRMKMIMSSAKATLISLAATHGLTFDRNFEIHSPDEIDDYIKQELSPSAHSNSSAAAATLHSKPLRPGRGKGTRTVAKFSSDST